MNTLQVDNAEFLPTVAEYIKHGHSVTINVKGNSMRPFIESGRDKAILTRAENIKVGDVVLAFTTDRRYVLHRVIKQDGDNITLMGDGNVRGTEHTTRANVLGRVETFVRGAQGQSISLESRTWRIYSIAWMKLLPLRRYLLWLYRKLWKVNK